MQRIFSAGRQAVKVRAIQVLALGMALVCVWVGWEVFRRYGLHPTEGGELAPLALRLALGGFLALLGVSFVVGMWVYGRCYVSQAEVDEERRVLHVTLSGFLVPSRLEVPLDAVEGSRDHDGRFWAGGVAVNAPWATVRLSGRRLPLIVDAQGEVHDEQLVNQHLLGIAPPRRRVVRPRR